MNNFKHTKDTLNFIVSFVFIDVKLIVIEVGFLEGEGEGVSKSREYFFLFFNALMLFLKKNKIHKK